MQCNHSFCGSPYSLTPFGQQCVQCQCCNTTNAGKPRPEVVGEGDVTTLVLPDGSTQMYFIPATPSKSPLPFNSTFGCLQYPVLNRPIYFIRSISNPVPLFQQTQQSSPQFGFQYQQPTFDCQPNIPLPPPPTQLQFHNDNCTSTSDLRYFFPQSRCCPKPPVSFATIQASAFTETGTCPGVFIDQCAASQAPAAMEIGTCPDMVCADCYHRQVILERAKSRTNADIQTSDVIFCDCQSSSKSKPKKIKKSKSSASVGRKSRHKTKKKKSRAECKCGVISDTSLEPSSNSKTSIKSNSSCSCSSQHSGFKSKKKAKSKKRKRTESESSVTCSIQSCPYSCISEVSNSSQTSASSKNEPKQKKQKKEKTTKSRKVKKEKIPKEEKPNKEKWTKDKKSKKDKVDKSTLPIPESTDPHVEIDRKPASRRVSVSRKTSTTSDTDSRTCCSDASIQTASNSKGNEKSHDIKKEIKERKHKLKKEMKEKESMIKKELKQKLSELNKEMKEKRSELDKNVKQTESKLKNEVKKTESKSKKNEVEKTESKSKKEHRPKVEKQKNKSKHDVQQSMTEDSDNCDCSRICSSTDISECNCCSSTAFLKMDVCCMTSQQSKLDKYFNVDCIRGESNSDVTSYLLAKAELDSAVPGQTVVWYPDETNIKEDLIIHQSNEGSTTANRVLTVDNSHHN